MRRIASLTLSYLLLMSQLALPVHGQGPLHQALLGKTPTGGAPTGTAFILTQTLGTLRNDFTGCVGFTFQTIGTTPNVTALGRWVVAGNSGTHVVYLYDATTFVLAASASINTSGATAGAYKYVAVTPVVLTVTQTYRLCSAETNLGDQWYSDDTTVNSTSAGIGTIVGAGGNTAVPPSSPNNFDGAAGQFTYGPVNLLTTP